MIIEIGQFAALLGLVAAILKFVDWMMSVDQKQALGKELRERLKKRNTSFVFVAKATIWAGFLEKNVFRKRNIDSGIFGQRRIAHRYCFRF